MRPPAPSSSARDDALAIFHAAVAGAQPGPATALALRNAELRDGPVRVIALGKAAHAMAAAAVEVLREQRLPLAHGLIVATHEAPPPDPSLEVLAGDHPLPGDRSAAAAARLGALAAERDAALALVLLSGGTSSLVGAPVDGVRAVDYRTLCTRLVDAGLDIGALNALRKRFSRWGAGRLAAALAPTPVLCLAVSDVIGDDPAAIGSGPCVGDALLAEDVRRILGEAGLLARLPASCLAHLAAATRGEAPETPKPGEARLAHATTRVVAGAAQMVDAAAHAAARLGYDASLARDPIAGRADRSGVQCAWRAVAVARTPDVPKPHCLLWRGETTVRVGASAPPGGRCQELALAAALELSHHPVAVTLLAAGTDGRDGPTDAAGACVDGTTWAAIRAAGIDPADALARHASHAALDAVDCLVRTGPTGTNVGDVVVALVHAS